MVDPSSLRAFAGRDWRALAESKEAYWLERKRAEGPAAGVRAAEALLAQVRGARGPIGPRRRSAKRIGACTCLWPRSPRVSGRLDR
jgi:hypothetical protein